MRGLLNAPVEGLSDIDGVKMDGLEFCRRAYEAWDAIKSEPDGRTELRTRNTGRAKKLIEEILPLAAFIQARYGPESRMCIQWLGGSQGFDAKCYYSGELVNHGYLPEEQHLEVTTAEPSKQYLVRERSAKHGGSFAAAGTRRDPTTREVLSKPVVVSHMEAQDAACRTITERVEAKRKKKYPEGTALIVYCNPGFPITAEEWADIVANVRGRLKPLSVPFGEIVLVHHSHGVSWVGGQGSEGLPKQHVASNEDLCSHRNQS